METGVTKTQKQDLKVAESILQSPTHTPLNPANSLIITPVQNHAFCTFIDEFENSFDKFIELVIWVENGKLVPLLNKLK